ncbi:Ubiquinone/menaquinone biosynthesis C-methylase UbiE [Thermomonospora echinospora]|uniref:Ubiquinone/menaquinone biosynthesis C-methylase UbiE n=2 Tax=Thermomonospora echinospora TaxID=1992 RepID=A0A1H5Y0I7_9ACTN|nr:Ubiquinone/menaquinone biosynthesis C-methylase UbiE [Thermomonospora echinospora]
MKAAVAGVFDRSADTYEQLGPEYFGPMGRALAARAAPRPGERVLDLGCGRGHCLVPLAEAVGPQGRVVGIDLAPGMVAATADDARRRGLSQVDVRVGDAAEPAVEPGSFDLVTAGFVIFFMPDPAAAAGAWLRALRPGGRLAISTFNGQDPNYEHLMKVVGAFLPQQQDRPRFELFRTAESVTAVLDEVGFQDVEHEHVTFETRFTGPDQWWEWIGSHGGRATLERLPEDRVEDARAAAYEAMEAARTPDGALAIYTEVRYTTARRP